MNQTNKYSVYRNNALFRFWMSHFQGIPSDAERSVCNYTHKYNLCKCVKLFLIIKPTRCTNFSTFILGMKLYMFRTVPLSIIRSLSLYTQQWYMSYKFVDSLRTGSGWNCSSILILLASCQQTCMTYTISVCTVKYSWWLTEELSETCRVSFQE